MMHSAPLNTFLMQYKWQLLSIFWLYSLVARHCTSHALALKLKLMGVNVYFYFVQFVLPRFSYQGHFGQCCDMTNMSFQHIISTLHSTYSLLEFITDWWQTNEWFSLRVRKQKAEIYDLYSWTGRFFLWHEDQWELQTECWFWSRFTDCWCIMISLFSVWPVCDDGDRSKDVGCSWLDTLCNLAISKIKNALNNPLARELSKNFWHEQFNSYDSIFATMLGCCERCCDANVARMFSVIVGTFCAVTRVFWVAAKTLLRCSKGASQSAP